MNKIKWILFLVFILFCDSVVAKQCVILLHGLARSADSMDEMETKLEKEGYFVSNIDYSSREYTIEVLAERAIDRGLSECKKKSATPINFVTHSLGGILVRLYLKNNIRNDIARVVMLGPPNHGSEVVDNLKNVPGFEWFNGPAGMQLGTGTTDLPNSLGPVNFEVGIIAGTQSMNLILSLFLPNPDDGKVSVESTKVEGMRDFITLPTMHPFMMTNDTVIEQTIYFLKNGKFLKTKSPD